MSFIKNLFKATLLKIFSKKYLFELLSNDYDISYIHGLMDDDESFMFNDHNMTEEEFVLFILYNFSEQTGLVILDKILSGLIETNLDAIKIINIYTEKKQELLKELISEISNATSLFEEGSNNQKDLDPIISPLTIYRKKT